MNVIRKQEPIVGVTTTTGQPIPFDGPGWISGDTVYGPVKTKPWLEQPDTAYSIPVGKIKHAWVRRKGPSPGAEIGIEILESIVIALEQLRWRPKRR